MRPALILTALLVAATARAQWEIQTAPTTADLRGIHALGNGIAWASGSDGAVLRTTDDGAHWQRCATPPDAEALDFRGIQAFDANTAIVMSSGKGPLSRLYKTTDGCHSWKLVFTNPDKDGFWDALHFDYLHPKYGSGWLLGDPVHGRFVLFDISDAGKKCTRQENEGLNAMPDKQAIFAASNSSMIRLRGKLVFGSGGTDGAKVYRETFLYFCKDSCPKDPHGQRNKWDAQTVPVGGASQGSGVFSLAGKDLPAGTPAVITVVAVGGDYTKPNDATNTAAFSSDEGEHWTAASTPPHGFRSSVAYSPTTETWITVGPNGTDISTDDGRNWRALKPGASEVPDADEHWNALSLPFVVGPHGRIGKLRVDALHAPAR